MTETFRTSEVDGPAEGYGHSKSLQTLGLASRVCEDLLDTGVMSNSLSTKSGNKKKLGENLLTEKTPMFVKIFPKKDSRFFT